MKKEKHNFSPLQRMDSFASSDLCAKAFESLQEPQ
jgi:hypothetical protein